MKVKLPKTSVIMLYSWNCRFDECLHEQDKPVSAHSIYCKLLKGLRNEGLNIVNDECLVSVWIAF
jgi:hypothetical protein